MPHYNDGTPAEIGDHVAGIPYNTNGKPIVGTVIQITEDADSCNCIVAYVEPTITTLPIADMARAQIHFPPVMTRAKGGRVRMTSSGEMEHLFLIGRFDYGALKDFMKVELAA